MCISHPQFAQFKHIPPTKLKPLWIAMNTHNKKNMNGLLEWIIKSVGYDFNMDECVYVHVCVSILCAIIGTFRCQNTNIMIFNKVNKYDEMP